MEPKSPGSISEVFSEQNFMGRLEVLSDEELVTRSRDGSGQYFGALVDRHTIVVYRVARSITGSHEEAEDVVQETFLRAFKNLDKFDASKSAFKTWLLTIARNQSINIISSLKRKTLKFFGDRDKGEAELEFSSNPLSQEPQDAETMLSIKQQFQMMEKALNKLPERQRTALLLKSQENLSYDEIASVMDVSVSSVESLIFRARKKIIGLVER
jgi:RNA polymerase sigma-70 factor, ECF subfamily